MMFPNHHPCITTSEHKSFGDLSHHPMEEKTNNKNEITKKHVKLQYWKYRMLIKIKGYAICAEHYLEDHMEYDGMNENGINPNGKH
jgi:hypothetical protein